MPQSCAQADPRGCAGESTGCVYVKGMNIYQVGIGFKGNAVGGFFSDFGLASPSHWAGTFWLYSVLRAVMAQGGVIFSMLMSV